MKNNVTTIMDRVEFKLNITVQKQSNGKFKWKINFSVQLLQAVFRQ